MQLAGVRDSVINIMQYRQTFYERRALEFIAANAPRGGIYFDVGTHIGNHLVFFAAFLADYVFGFEPLPIYVEAARENIRANHVAARVFPHALGRHTGRVTHQDYAAISGTMIEMETRPLDDVVRDIRLNAQYRTMPISFLKIDTDGMDLAVLRGAHKTLTTERPHVFVEVASDKLRRDVPAFMKSLDYEHDERFASQTPAYYYRPK